MFQASPAPIGIGEEVERLLAAGRAYRCFMSIDELALPSVSGPARRDRAMPLAVARASTTEGDRDQVRMW